MITESTVVLAMKELPPTLNTIINAARTSKFLSAQLKKLWHAKIGYFVSKLPKIEGKIYLECVWFVKNRRRDPDNITACQKYILDTLVEQARIEDDNLSVIQSPTIHHFIISDFDGFAIVMRNESDFHERMFEDISLPPKEAILKIQKIGNVIPNDAAKRTRPKRVLRKKATVFKKSSRR